jgi:quercetin 2,3-dioxygenase
VQWMTAGSGILHKEYHEQEYARRGGPFQMAQLWVNLPRQHKLSPPRYQALVAEQMGLVTLPDGAGTVRVVAGEYQGVRGPAQTFTRIDVFDVRLARGGAAPFEFPAHHNLAMLVMEGEVTLNGKPASKHDFALFANEGEQVRVEASSDAQLLVLSGEPIHEPVVSYGPFVMNTEQEIVQAFEDYRSGKFGRLDD